MKAEKPLFPSPISDLRSSSSAPWLSVRNAASAEDPTEILIYGTIGKDYFDDSGVGAEQFAAALQAVPKSQQIRLRIHSPGGSVWDGLAIYHMILARRETVTAQIDGVAFSAASFIAMAASKILMPSTARMMIHDAAGISFGNAEETRKLADLLDQESDNIANIYAQKTGKTAKAIRKLMQAETWMTGTEAKAEGFADELIDGAALSNKFDLSIFRNVPAALAPTTPLTTTPPPSAEPISSLLSPVHLSAITPALEPRNHTMKREKIVALLNRLGIKFEATATDDQLFTLLESAPAPTAVAVAPATAAVAVAPAPVAAVAVAAEPGYGALTAEVATLRAAHNAERKSRITAAVTESINASRIPANQADQWIARCLADESLVALLEGLPVNLPGASPVNIELIGEDPRQIEKAILNLWGKGSHDPVEARARGRTRAEIINKNLGRLWPILNAGTNTVATDLKRTVILQQMIRAFAIRLLPLGAFSTVFNGIKLQGTDKVAVPYFALDTTTSDDFEAATGYDVFGDTNSDAKTITVNKRKYQGLFWTSAELARQPFMDIGMGAMLKAEQLAIDCVNDVLALVTASTFGTAAHTGVAAAFDSADVTDLYGVADVANWPTSGRSIFLNSAYDVNLLKDSSVKSALNFGDSSPIRDGVIKNILGFNYFKDCRVPGNSENLQGFIAFRSALLVAFSPVDPTPEVRSQLTRYEVVTEPTTGVTFEYRLWGDATLDRSKEIIEANYGSIAGEAAALKRIVSS